MYRQRTEHAVDGRILHGESGYRRVPEPGRIELVIAHPTGVVEIAEGTLDGVCVSVASTRIGRTGSAKEVTAIERDHHLAAELHVPGRASSTNYRRSSTGQGASLARISGSPVNNAASCATAVAIANASAYARG